MKPGPARDWRTDGETVVLVREFGEESPAWEDDRGFVELYGSLQGKSLVSPHRCYVIYNFARHANHLNGDFVQVGVYRGGTAKLIAGIKSPQKNLFLFDTFCGLPAPGPKDYRFSEGEFSDTSIEEVREYLGDDPTVAVTQGYFPDCASPELDQRRFCFAYLDVDLYASNYGVLTYIYPRMVEGGVIVLDDYGLDGSGIQQSTDDFLKSHCAIEIPMRFTRFQAVIIKAAPQRP